MFGLLALLGTLASPQTVDRPAPVSASICATPGACRHVDSVRIESAEGEVTTLPIDDDLPWVVRDNIMLTPGETVTVTLEPKGGVLVPRLVRGGPEASATRLAEGEVRFSLSPSNKGSLMLTAESRRPETLDYAALMVTEPGGPKRTSVCSLQPGIPVYESWQGPIRQLALWSFRPTTEPGCKEVTFPAPATAAAPAPAPKRTPSPSNPAPMPEGR